MAQLKMYWKRQTPAPIELPEGFTVVNYKDESDIPAWIEICKNGLVGDEATEENFKGAILECDDLVPEKDLFFVDYNGEHVATTAVIYHPAKNMGHVHMVSVRSDMRGKGLGNVLNQIAVNKLYNDGCDYAFLTTDEWRKAAVKSYLSYGFQPVEYDEGMYDRWVAVMKEYGIKELEMLKEEDASHHCFIKLED